MNCPVCSGEKNYISMRTYDDRYGYPGTFTQFRCKECGHKFVDLNLTSTQLTELYTSYYPRKSFDIRQCKPHKEEKGLVTWFNGLNSSAFRKVPQNVCVLDVGCGFGQSLGYHSARGCEVYGVEADENIRRVAEKFGYKVHVGLFDDSNYKSDYFDYVTMDQVIEHVTDPLMTLKGVARILKPGGTVILSTPNASGWGANLFGNRWINWHTPYHLQFFSRASIRLAAEQAGLVVDEVKTITNSEWLYYQWVHLATFPKIAMPSSFWSPNKRRSVMQRTILLAIGLIHKTKINHLVTRFFDGLGLGDNYVIVLRKP